MQFDSIFRADEPAVAIRGIHLDLKGTPPTAERLLRLLDIFAAARYNAVLVEWEDMFPWTVDERFRNETAYTRSEVERFHTAAAGLGIEIIPLVQCLGHMETPLNTPGYEHLRELPHRADVLNPLAPGARELVEKMVDDVLALNPNVRYFHLGGDEAWSFGSHPDTKAWLEQHSRGELYLHHVEPIIDKLSARGIRTMLWHDMMCHWDADALRRLGAKADLVVWGYSGRPGVPGDPHYGREVIERFHENGITMWGGTAYKGATGINVDLPDIGMHQDNALGHVEVAAEFGYAGIIATAWSRICTHRVQCEPIDACLDSMLNIGIILHDGAPPEGGIEACVAALDTIGERESFEACKAAMQKLTDARKAAWKAIAQLREQIAMASAEERRRAGGIEISDLATLDGHVAAARSAADDARKALGGLMQSLWVERYLEERIGPLAEERQLLASRVQELDPDGFAAAF